MIFNQTTNNIDYQLYQRTIRKIYNSELTFIQSSMFTSAEWLTEAAFPNAVTVGDQAFGYCTSLKYISLPSASSLSIRAFFHCSNLSTINLPNVTTLGMQAFLGCYQLSSVSIPNITSIPSSCFQYCYNLSQISLPDISYIGAYAFYNCSTLVSVELRNVSSVPSITTAFGDTPLTKSYITNRSGAIYIPSSLYSNFMNVYNWRKCASALTAMSVPPYSASILSCIKLWDESGYTRTVSSGYNIFSLPGPMSNGLYATLATGQILTNKSCIINMPGCYGLDEVGGPYVYLSDTEPTSYANLGTLIYTNPYNFQETEYDDCLYIPSGNYGKYITLKAPVDYSYDAIYVEFTPFIYDTSTGNKYILGWITG